MTDDGGPDWERIARRAVAARTESFFDAEVRTRAYRVAEAIEAGEDPSEEFWLLVVRYGEFVDRLATDLEQVGTLESDSQRLALFRSARLVQGSFARLGEHAETSAPDCGDRRRVVDAARASLAEAGSLLDDLAEGGTDGGRRSGADGEGQAPEDDAGRASADGDSRTADDDAGDDR